MTATHAGPRLSLQAEKASELMTPNPISISANAPVSEAITMLTERGFSAAPVIDEAGRPVGVVSQADLLVHQRERLRLEPAETEGGDSTPVGDIMTPGVFSVAPDTSAVSVIEQLVELNVHRLFVVDRDGALVGVVTTLDLLRHLKP